ncbi:MULTISPECIES: hypothetical protein [unclassified Iodidimonas]|jgi:hypothetical protein|uniref:hypothetical protein n=1 Tax=unclassified Iodidimonas TaxID=2626145 RepID=UPI002482C082|nr:MULTISPECIES: hypothetical protein [unclassified Iodidimonas]
MTTGLFRSIFLPLLAAITLSACASNSPADQRRARDNMTERLSQIPTVDISSRLYSQAIEMKRNGNCNGAMPLFYRLANRGGGFELAQYHLADCLLRIATPSITNTDWLEGLIWLRRSAEAGAPEAQGLLAHLYATGPGDIANKTEAAMWFSLYEKNPARKKPGFSYALTPAQQAAILKALDAETLAKGDALANQWQSTIWQPPSAGRLAPEAPRSEGGIDMLQPQ